MERIKCNHNKHNCMVVNCNRIFPLKQGVIFIVLVATVYFVWKKFWEEVLFSMALKIVR
jgi:hypothetical protein